MAEQKQTPLDAALDELDACSQAIESTGEAARDVHAAVRDSGRWPLPRPPSSRTPPEKQG